MYSPDGVHVMDMCGCPADLFGIVSLGIHLVAYLTYTPRTDQGTGCDGVR